jgi:uncharacterized integral membrane protein
VLRRLLGVLLAFPAFLLLVTLAVTNKHPVQLKLDPFRPEDPAILIEASFFYFLLGAMIVGVLLGGFATWLSQGHWRRSARTRARDALHWRAEADRLARERDQSVAASGQTGLGKALATIRR